jgi:hypothetical protein
MAKSSEPPTSSQPPFTAQEAIEFMQRMWNPFGMPVPGFGVPPAAPGSASAGGSATPGAQSSTAPLPYPNPAAIFMTLDPADIERRIGELRVIENWLAMSLNFMQMSIRTLELQKASLEALRGTAMPKTEGGRGKG